MVGQLQITIPKNAEIREIVFEADHLSAEFFKDISFSVRSGEILGFAGLMGAGRTEVMRAIFGIDKLKSGTIKINGKSLTINNPHKQSKKELAF